MSAILGINAFHADSAACLLIDGKLVGAVAEERLGSRLKHSSAFPENAVRWLLSDNGLTLRDVTHVAISRDPSRTRRAKLRYVMSHPFGGTKAALEHFKRTHRTKNILQLLAEACGEDLRTLSMRRVAVEHHLAHIASAYYCSPFDHQTSGFSYDASGDFVSAMAAQCEGASIRVLDRVTLPHSLGFFYTAFCQFIGFDAFGEEYKVMGLAPYGEDVYEDLMRELILLPENGWFAMAPGAFGMHEGGQSGSVDASGKLVMGKLWRDPIQRALGPPAQRGSIGTREKNIARSVQRRFEDAAVHCINHLHKLNSSSRLVMAGGCALNGVANSRLLQATPFDEVYLQSASSDDGTCLGAALWTWHNVVKGKERFHMEHSFWGPGYSEPRLRSAAASTGLAVQEFSDTESMLSSVAELIAQGLVLGWYQGRSEWGPRALGNRSILANPAIRTMKDTINAKIKRRESFRPFAPSVLREDVRIYFKQDVFSPFMMHVVKLRPEWRERLPAVTHVDGTGRLQSVDKDSNALYYKLIEQVKARTGIGMVLNTSFNENEPIVDTPEQAVACFMRTDMDAICLGRYLVRKPA